MKLSLVDNTLFLDNSALELISTCKRQAELYILHKREKNADRPALRFGGIIHKALEALYLNQGKPIQELKGLMLTAITKGFDAWTPEAEEFRNYDCACSFISRYLEEYPVEPFTVHSVETSFTVDFGVFTMSDGTEIKVVWQGRIDLIGEREGKRFFMDHKTTSMMGPTYFKEFDMSSQFRGYAWAMRKLLGEMPTFGWVNGLGIRKPTKTGKAFEFSRYPVHFVPDQLDEWYLDTQALIAEFLQCAEVGFFPRQTKWCVGKYGACQYFDVCVLPREHRATMLASGDFKPVTWDPTKNED